MTAHPSDRNRRWFHDRVWKWLAVGIVLFVLLLIGIGVGSYLFYSSTAGRSVVGPSTRGAQTSTTAPTRPTPAVQSAPGSTEPPRLWYQGGTLHHATLVEWWRSTDENRLATAADFASAILKPTSVEQVRQPAADMQACISEVANGAVLGPVKGFDAGRPVTEVAAVCAALLKWKRPPG